MPDGSRPVRNFCIVAHVDHGKSTLADRLLEATGAVASKDMMEQVGVDPDEVILASAKKGVGIDEILERIVTSIPAPKGDPSASLRAFIFDSVFDQYQGVVAYIRVVEGSIRPRQKIRLLAT